LRLYDIQNKYLDEVSEHVTEENTLLKLFLDEPNNAITEISSYFIHFDGNMNFLEQPEFDERKSILSFLGFIQRQDVLINLMKRHESGKDYSILMGEDLIRPELVEYAMIYAKYEIYGIPGYLGIVGPVRMNYKRNIPLVRDFARTITEITKKGMMVKQNGRN